MLGPALTDNSIELSPVIFGCDPTVDNLSLFPLPISIPASLTKRSTNVPNVCKLELITVDFIVFPVNVSAAAVIVMFDVPSNVTPLIDLPGFNLVAEAEFPVKVCPSIKGETILLKKLVPLVALTFHTSVPLNAAAVIS